MSRAVVLVSGWSGAKSNAYWRPLARKFEKAGYDVVQAGFANHGFSHIYSSSRDVVATLEDIRKDYEHITLIGHSMGGLVGRYVIQRMGREDLVECYVSLGTPHSGSVLAALAPWSPSAAQMRVGSAFLRRLAETPWPEEIPALALQGAWEEIVLPRENAEFSHAKNIAISYATHVGLIFMPQTFTEISNWLEQAS